MKSSGREDLILNLLRSKIVEGLKQLITEQWLYIIWKVQEKDISILEGKRNEAMESQY